ncbi:MAG TPA: endonuclease/exonuclease/phosphatase family protein, partial [Rectinema sp.]|nr:endonuclease/exonuclease/phosphatase family protein [Rectinema sp.]
MNMNKLHLSKSKTRYIIVVFLAILSLSIHPLCAQNQCSVPGLPTIRIATWNVKDCSATNQKTKEAFLLHSFIAEAIKEARIDIIAFQEIQIEGRKGADIALLQDALMSIDWAMPHVAWTRSPLNDDLAILSRFPITESQTILAPSEQPWPRPVLEACIDLGDMLLYLYTAHFKAYADQESLSARLAQAQALASHIRQYFGQSIKETAIILAGDFNTVSSYDMQSKIGTVDLLQLRDNEDSTDDFLSLNLEWLNFKPTYKSKSY